MKPALSAVERVPISVRQTTTSRISLAIATLALILITACGTTPGTTSTAIVEITQPTQATPTTEAPPKPASPPNDSAPARSQPDHAPAPTISPVEAQPTLANESRTQAESPKPTPVPAATPLPQNNSASATATTAPSTAPAPTTSAPAVAPNATSPVPDNTPAPTAAPITTPTPLPTAALDPTPRPTPGPISRSTQFVPLDEPAYVTRENASTNITNDSYVLGVANNGEARAYPLDMMWYHHIANDTVGGEPWLVTY